MGDNGAPSDLPAWGRRLFGWLMPRDQREAVLGDVHEEFARRREADGPRSAHAWFRRQLLRSVAPGVRHKLGAARASLGGEWGVGEAMIMWATEIRLAFRTLAKRPGFTGTVVLTLSLGVGATTGLFSVFQSVFLRPLPLPDSERVVVVMGAGAFGCCGPASGPEYLDWVERARAFDELAGVSPGFVNLTGLNEVERVYSARVTPSAFAVTGVEPLLGRTFEAEDAVSGGVVVLSYELWSRLYGDGGEVIGRGFEVDGVVRTVVGVMPEGFDVPSPWMGTQRHMAYFPLLGADLLENRGSRWMPVIGRLADGFDVDAAQEDMDRVTADLEREYPDTHTDRTTVVSTMHEYLYGSHGNQLLLILGAAGLVLLIACGNVAGLQLARAIGRETELAVRGAMGASRAAVVRLLFSESAVLAAAGGLGGVLIAQVVIAGLRAILPPNMPRTEAITIDGLVLGFGLVATLAAVCVFGLVPALFSSRSELAVVVREGERGSSAPRKERLRDIFIVAQIAVGLVLANGAGLLVRSYTELRGEDMGFETEGVITMQISGVGPQYDEGGARERYFEEVNAAVAALPEVETVGFLSRLPLYGGSNGHVQIEGWPQRANQEEGPLVEVTSIIGPSLDAMGIPLLRGRTLQPEDSISGAVGVLVNQAMVDEVWPNEDPIGRRFSFADGPPWLTVVGVVGDARQWGPETEPIAQTYAPYSRGWSSGGYLSIRVRSWTPGLASEIRDAVRTVDPTQATYTLTGMDERLAARLAGRRFYTSLIAVFALAALLLASAGIYGTVSYFVARRMRELGVRIALGAGGTGIVALVVRRAGRLAVWGICLGLVGVWLSTSIAESFVYSVSAVDPLTLVAGCILLVAATLAASVVPALRAVHVSPVQALRSE